jgi:hypothetical protein
MFIFEALLHRPIGLHRAEGSLSEADSNQADAEAEGLHRCRPEY